MWRMPHNYSAKTAWNSMPKTRCAVESLRKNGRSKLNRVGTGQNGPSPWG